MSKDNTEQRKKAYFISRMFYEEELRNYTDDENEIKARIEIIKEKIQRFDPNDILTDKETIINHDSFMDLLGHCIKGHKDPYTFNEQRLNELISDYDNINTFFNDEGDNAFKILEEYGDYVKKDSNGFYQIDDTIINKVLDDNDFLISDSTTKDRIKDEIFNTWENQKELLTQETLNRDSEKNNGINFKHFIFCEEYLKRGKIKPTCECLGISRNTAYTWLKDEKVQAYLQSRKDEIKQETDNTFLNTYSTCFDELGNIINGFSDTSDKIKAIDIFLKHYENIEKLKQPTSEG